MNEDLKRTLILFAKVLSLVLYAMITIATCAAAWNGRPGTTISIAAGILLAVNGYVIYRKVKKLKE